MYSSEVILIIIANVNYLRLQDAQKLADSWGIPYVECSSKSGDHVAEVFHTLLKEIEKDDGLLVESDAGGCVLL
jgi:Ras family protein